MAAFAIIQQGAGCRHVPFSIEGVRKQWGNRLLSGTNRSSILGMEVSVKRAPTRQTTDGLGEKGPSGPVCFSTLSSPCVRSQVTRKGGSGFKLEIGFHSEDEKPESKPRERSGLCRRMTAGIND